MLQLEALERQTYAHGQVIATYQAAGARDLEIPSFTDVRAEFDANLTAEPAPESPKLMLLRELGVA